MTVDEGKYDRIAVGVAKSMGGEGGTMRGMYYARDRRPLDLAGWCARYEDLSYRLIAPQVSCGRVWVSTVWLGVGFGKAPRIFETAVTRWNRRNHTPDFSQSEIYKWSTEEQALKGHKLLARLVLQRKWKWDN